MDKNQAKTIRAWMRRNFKSHVDPKTNEIDMTSLVESWDRECASGSDTLDSNHIAWDIAAEFMQ